MLNEVKHLAFTGCHEVEILRFRLRMTLRHSLDAEEDQGRGLNIRYWQRFQAQLDF